MKVRKYNIWCWLVEVLSIWKKIQADISPYSPDENSQGACHTFS